MTHPYSDTSEPCGGGRVDAGTESETVAAGSLAERILVGEGRTDGRKGLVQISADGRELIVGVNPSGHPFSWSLAVINRDQAGELRDWLAWWLS